MPLLPHLGAGRCRRGCGSEAEGACGAGAGFLCIQEGSQPGPRLDRKARARKDPTAQWGFKANQACNIGPPRLGPLASTRVAARLLALLRRAKKHSFN